MPTSKMRPLRLLIAGLIAASLGPAATGAEPTTQQRSELLAFGSEAPDIAGIILHGDPGTRLSKYRGRVVAVDFWATWCTPCLQSMPELNRIRAELVREGWGDRFEIVGVNVDNDVALARRFLEVHPADYPIIGDPIGIAMKRYGPWKLPATFLLDPSGKVQMIWLGYADYFANDIKKTALEELRKLPAPAAPASP